MIDVSFLHATVVNAGLLVPCFCAALLLGVLSRRWPADGIGYQALAALAFCAMVALLIAFTALSPIGSAIDARAAPALLSGLLGGWPATLATAVVGGSIRYAVGGPFALGGAISVVAYCLVGLLFRRFFPWSGPRMLQRLSGLAFAGTLAILPTFFIHVPIGLGWQSMTTLMPVLVPLNLISILLLGFAYLAGRKIESTREESRLLQNALAWTDNGVLVTEATPGQVIVYVNDAIERSTGYTPQDLVGQSPRIFHKGLEDQPGLARLRRAIDRRERCSVELLNRRKDGRAFINHLTISPVANPSGQVTHFIGIQDDITQLRAQEHLVYMATEYLPLSVAVIGPDETIQLVNSAFRAWYGVAEEEAEGQKLSDLVGVSEYERLHEAVQQAMAGGSVERELSLDSPSRGRWTTVRETLVPAFKGAMDGLGGCIWMVEDITDQRNAEEELRQANKMRSIGDLTGGIAHDFNNLNAVVIGNLELLEETARAPDQSPLLSEALDAAYRGADLTRSLLSYARRAPLQPRVFSAGKQIETLRPLLQASVPENITLNISSSPFLQPVCLDAHSFDNAVLNLVLNARDALVGRRDGRIDVDVVLHIDPFVEDPATQWFAGDRPAGVSGPHVMISVSDNGDGVASEMRARLFEPFATTKGLEIGNGLGLSMVHGFVHQSGGFMRLGDRPDGGTVACLHFPAQPEGVLTTPQKRPQDRGLRVAGRPAVFIVEDEDSVRRLMVHRLERIGFLVSAFATAEEALVKFEAETPPDVLLSDVVLTGQIQGTDLARTVRDRWPSVKTILASGYPASHLSEEAQIVYEAFLQKPFSHSDLVAAIRACLPCNNGCQNDPVPLAASNEP
ncbi:MAG: PAS domain S-box protein [Pseudomonadota bacterium]